MDFILLLSLVISMILGVIIVNKGYNVYMKIMDIDYMYISTRTKRALYILVGGFIWIVFLGIMFALV